MAPQPDRARIVFTPSGRRGEFAYGTSVLDAARALGVDLDSVCGGRSICGRCQVVPVAGDFPVHGFVSAPDNLTAFTPDEERYAARRGLADDRRLGCKARLAGDLVVDVPAESQLHRQVVRKRVEVADITVDPVLRLYYLEVPPPTLDESVSDVERVLRTLITEWQLDGLTVTRTAIADIRTALCGPDVGMTVAVRDGNAIVAAWPDLRDVALGVAFDVGSTTLAGYLCDLRTGETIASAGRMNPQIRFGEDLMSRVSYVMMQPEGSDELTGAVRHALDAMIGDLVEEAGVDRDDILELTLVGNPIMHHLVFGFDVRPLGTAPFALATAGAIDVAATDLGLNAHRAARLHSLPCIAGHVGADTAAAILSEAPYRADGIQLLVDVGTNAEIVLGGRDRLLAASSPTGPAFEGAQISAGQRAAPGAIERVRVDPVTLEPRYKVIGCDSWSDEEGFAAEISSIGVSGICGSGIIEAVAELYLAGLVSADGGFADDAIARTDRVVADGRTFSYRICDAVAVTQNDIRAIQLAKAALLAGVRLLMDHLGVDHVDQIRLAGAFGSHIDTRYAMALGLIPDCDLGRVSAAGNAAGAGAIIALLNRASRLEIADVVRKIDKIETAVAPRFQDHFVAAMALPSGAAEHPNLAAVVTLPEAPIDHPRRRRRGDKT
jgi:uncharacterized 2Fe-2S/4Fe-4S cluster protein (DUF4445 family)